jgi:hypothetical protein
VRVDAHEKNSHAPGDPILDHSPVPVYVIASAAKQSPHRLA